jgi:hypothetical protein
MLVEQQEKKTETNTHGKKSKKAPCVNRIDNFFYPENGCKALWFLI